MAYVYRHIRVDKNEPFYIGVSITDDNYRRAYRRSDRNKLWKNIVAKTDYEVEILLDNVSEKILYDKESEFITLYGMLYNHTGSLANLTFGGKGTKGSKHNLGRKWNETSKIKLSNSKKLMTDITKSKIRKAHIGKKASIETKEKMSESKKGYKHTEEAKKNMSIAQSNRVQSPCPDYLKRKIDQFDLNMNFIKTHNSISELGLLGFSIGNISMCCNGKRKYHKGYIFKYNNNNNNNPSA